MRYPKLTRVEVILLCICILVTITSGIVIIFNSLYLRGTCMTVNCHYTLINNTCYIEVSNTTSTLCVTSMDRCNTVEDMMRDRVEGMIGDTMKEFNCYITNEKLFECPVMEPNCNRQSAIFLMFYSSLVFIIAITGIAMIVIFSNRRRVRNKEYFLILDDSSL